MKIKSDFITNSSSASFLLALKKDVTKDDVEKSVSLDDVKSFSSGDWMKGMIADALYLEESFVEAMPECDLAKLVFDALVKSILQKAKGGTVLGEWTVGIGTCGNESEGLLDNFMYDKNLANTDFLKFKTEY